MKLKLKETPEQVELIRAMGSKNKETSAQALEIFAGFIGPVIQQVLPQLFSAGMIYEDFTYDEDDSPSIQLDLYYGTRPNHIQVWSQNLAGGLATNLIVGAGEMKIATYQLETAISWFKKYARRSRLDVISAAMTRMAAELARKQDKNGWVVILRGLAEAVTNGIKHTIPSTTQNVFQVDDLNRLLTLNKRLNTGWAGGTSDTQYSNGITDLFFSPELMEQVRGFAYQPMNTRGVPNSDESTALGLPDAIRQEIFRNAGTQSIYNIGLHPLNEFGDGQQFNLLFGQFATAGVAFGGANFNSATDQIAVGIDLQRGGLVRALAKNADNGGTAIVSTDDQFTIRSDKQGVFCAVEEGRVLVDSRVLNGLIV